MMNIHETITDADILRKGYMICDGFVFSKLEHAPVFDCLVIRYPADAIAASFRSAISARSLEEHIQLVEKYQLEKAIVVCDDLSFITRCPSLKNVAVYPALTAKHVFDFSPLYQMPNIRELICATSYGEKNHLHSCIDYSKLEGLHSVSAAGIGHLGYENIPHLKKLWLSDSKRHFDFSNISCSDMLTDVTIMLCGIRSLSGMEQHPEIQHLALYHCRSLLDISAIKCLSKSLRTLTIECCSQITDFSALEELGELEHLHLYGSNSVPNLQFLRNLKKLKTFCFTINVLDGDLTLCTSIPYVSCKNRRHYNYRDRDLPKKLSQRQTD